MEHFIWIACNQNGQYKVFRQRPNRNTIRNVWTGDYDAKGQLALFHLENIGLQLPTLTWDNEPVKIKITLAYEEES